MGYFDDPTGVLFKRDRNGNSVFFPWGILGSGRLLPDESTELRVRGYVRRWYRISLPMILGVAIVGGAWSFLLVLPLSAWFYFGLKPLLADCLYSEEKLSLKEANAFVAASHSRLTLWLIFVCFVSCLLGGTLMLTIAKSSREIMMGWLSVVVFSVFCVKTGYIIKLKHAQPIIPADGQEALVL